MKKVTYLIFALLMLLFAAGYGSMAAGEEISAIQEATESSAPEPQPIFDGKITEIKEKFFSTQVYDVYINTSDYLGTAIKLEGIFSTEIYPGNGQTYHFVNRYTPGCCEGEMFTIGFEVIYDGEYPEQNAWVEAIGVLEWYDEDGQDYLHLVLFSLKTLEERGQEIVLQ